MPKITSLFYCLLLPVLVSITGCASHESRYPAEVRAGGKDRVSTITLRTDEMEFTLDDGSTTEVALKLAQTTIEDGSKRRRAFMTLDSGEHRYIGELAPIFDDPQLEFLFFTIRNAHFVLLWVDENLLEDPRDIWLMRPEQLATDDSPIKRLRHPHSRRVTNQAAYFIIGADEASLWSSLEEIALFGGSREDGKPTWSRTFDPPLLIEQNYVEVFLQ